MIRILNLIDMESPLTMYEVSRIGDTDQWTLARLDVGLSGPEDVATDSVPGETLHTGSTDEVLRLVRVLMATPKHVDCGGCGCPLERCGPKLWVQGRKCCPECEHS